MAQSDLEDLVGLHLDAEVSHFLGGVRSPAQTADYLAQNLDHWREYGFGLWTLRTPKGAFAGRAGLRHVEVEGVRELEIAYTLSRPHWGQGLATEIASALVGIWRRQLMQATLVGIVAKGHSASDRVLLKAGFTFERDATFHGAAIGLFRQAR